MAKKPAPKLNTVAYHSGNSPEMQIRFIDDFLNLEVKGYAHYVVTTRALPNIMDGLKVGGRKIMWAAINGDLRKYKKIKMVDLIGDTMKYEFHHGESSLKSTIEQFGSSHLFEAAPLRIIGQKGTLRVPDATTAARYLEVALTENVELFKVDIDLLQLKFEDGKVTEPKHFLPLVPVILLWRTNSPGFGFSFRSFSFSIGDVIDATLSAVVNGTCSGVWDFPLRPRVVGVKDENILWNGAKQAWYNVGTYRISGDMLVVTDLPYNVSFKKYTILLNELKESGAIADWFNQKTKAEPIKYVITFPAGGLARAYRDKWKFYGTFRLYTKIPKLTLNVIDRDCKSIIYFDTPADLIDGFVRRRLAIFHQRKARQIQLLEKAIEDLTDKAKFIRLVVDGKIVVVKRAKADIEADCTKFGVTTAGMSLEIYRLTLEEIEKANQRIAAMGRELLYVRETTVEELYVSELVELRRRLVGIGSGTAPRPPEKKQQAIEVI